MLLNLSRDNEKGDVKMELPKYKVYVKTNDDDVIIRCEGGATESKDLTGWRDIDSGRRFALETRKQRADFTDGR